MATGGSRGWSRSFRSDPHLQQYFLDKVVTTGKTLGRGSYGSVEEVSQKYFTFARNLEESLQAMFVCLTS